MGKLATATQSVEPDERLARERKAVAEKLADATLGAMEELAEQGQLHPEVAQALRVEWPSAWPAGTTKPRHI